MQLGIELMMFRSWAEYPNNYATCPHYTLPCIKYTCNFGQCSLRKKYYSRVIYTNFSVVLHCNGKEEDSVRFVINAVWNTLNKTSQILYGANLKMSSGLYQYWLQMYTPNVKLMWKSHIYGFSRKSMYLSSFYAYFLNWHELRWVIPIGVCLYLELLLCESEE